MSSCTIKQCLIESDPARLEGIARQRSAENLPGLRKTPGCLPPGGISLQPPEGSKPSGGFLTTPPTPCPDGRKECGYLLDVATVFPCPLLRQIPMCPQVEMRPLAGEGMDGKGVSVGILAVSPSVASLDIWQFYHILLPRRRCRRSDMLCETTCWGNAPSSKSSSTCERR